MAGELFKLADRLKALRESKNMTQADVARHMGLTRSSINAWEMGISVPSTPCIIGLAELFGVSCDYLLGKGGELALNVDGLDRREVALLAELIEHLKKNREGKDDRY